MPGGVSGTVSALGGGYMLMQGGDSLQFIAEKDLSDILEGLKADTHTAPLCPPALPVGAGSCCLCRAQR